MKNLLPFLALAVLFAVPGCDSDSPTGGGNADSVRVSFSTMARTPTFRVATGVTISRARFVVRDIRLHTVDGPEESEFETEPVLLELDLSGVLNRIAIGSVPPDLYDEVRFKVHKLDDDDAADRRALADPVFADFAEPERLSIIIEGTVDGEGGATPFVFESDLNEEQRSPIIPALALEAESNQVNLTLVMDTGMWFSNEGGGSLDPNRPEDRDLIEENIRASIDAFEDNDEDGIPDFED